MGAPSVAASLVLTKGQLAIDVCSAAHADRISFDFACDDEVSGNCRQLREFFEASDQAYVLRVPSNFVLTLAWGPKLTCAQAVGRLLKDKRRWEVRSAGSGSKGELVCLGWIAAASPRRSKTYLSRRWNASWHRTASPCTWRRCTRAHRCPAAGRPSPQLAPAYGAAITTMTRSCGPSSSGSAADGPDRG